MPQTEAAASNRLAAGMTWRGRGVVICESESAEAVANWALNWNSLLDADVVPVLDDNETRALGKSREKSP